MHLIVPGPLGDFSCLKVVNNNKRGRTAYSLLQLAQRGTVRFSGRGWYPMTLARHLNLLAFSVEERIWESVEMGMLSCEVTEEEEVRMKLARSFTWDNVLRFQFFFLDKCFQFLLVRAVEYLLEGERTAAEKVTQQEQSLFHPFHRESTCKHWLQLWLPNCSEQDN